MDTSRLSERIKEIALDLVSQKSILETDDEVLMSEKVYGIMSEMGYYKKHPEKLYMLDVRDDPWKRKIVVAIMNGEKAPSKKTVAFIGHTDTVGISDYGQYEEFATKPDELLEIMKGLKAIPQEAKDDIATGKYIFGRGVFDMKSGDANVIALMEAIGDDIENFEGNIIFSAVCDEEGNSSGMLRFVPELLRLRDEEGYDIQAILDPDYIAPRYPGDPNQYLYIGTVGKLMPTFLAVGRETHVGESFDGLDPNQITAELTSRINLNPEFSDVVEGEVTLPPVTLKLRDMKPEYSVQIAKKSIVFFNYATHSKTPDFVLDEMVRVGKECFQKTIDTLNERYAKYCELCGSEKRELPWKERTLKYSELYELVKAEVPDLDEKVEKYTREIKEDRRYDSREQTAKVVEYVHSLWSDVNPVLIVYLTPPYYPHIYVEGKRESEAKLLKAANDAVKKVQPKYTQYSLVDKKFLPCISDLSYATAPKEEAAVEALRTNMPGFGIIYKLPLDEMRALDLPVADIGSYGKDAHKFTERVEAEFSYKVLPELLYETMMGLLE